MVINFARLDMHDKPVLVLKNAGGRTLGVLGDAFNVELELNYNEVSELSFDYPDRVDGESTPLFDALSGMRTIEVEDLGQYTLVNPEVSDDGIRRLKRCKAHSLEYEFTYKKITLATDTYKFWDADTAKQGNTVLGMIMELMPAWHVYEVPRSIMNKYRTFEVSNENLYNFIKGTVQESFGCIFEFDTDMRRVIVRDVEEEPAHQPVYLSTENLAKSITIREDSESLVTRLDVNGAEGVNIRDVNPTGTNQIINLDHFMNETNFDGLLIEKYRDWKELCELRRPTYYLLSVKYSMLIMESATEQAKLTDMQGELVSLDNQRAVAIDAIAKGLATQAMLDQANAAYAAQETAVTAQQARLTALEQEKADALDALKAIVQECSYTSYFDDSEIAAMDMYIRDGEITDDTFVSVLSSYSDTGSTDQLTNIRLTVTNAEYTDIADGTGMLYDVRGGEIALASKMTAELISGVLSVGSDDKCVFTASLHGGQYKGEEFTGGSLSATGTLRNLQTTDGVIQGNITGYLYLTLNPSEYQRRSVAWDLFEYGETLAKKLSQPTYTFSVSSANFLALNDFEEFKNKLRIGEKIYLDTGDNVLQPVCIGVRFSFENISELELKFSDSYVQSDSAFKLASLLEQSVSMGRTVSAGRFNYESFQDSGASSELHDFITSSLDISKNSILSSSEQAISWDEAGLRFRKWANAAKTAYEDEQIWMNNNMIVMTDDAWETAKMAIGKFYDEKEDKTYWGVVAPAVVGTLLAGESLVIESETTYDGGTSVFRVDGDGCRMHNGAISVTGEPNTVWTYRVISPWDSYNPGTITNINLDIDDLSTDDIGYTIVDAEEEGGESGGGDEPVEGGDIPAEEEG